MTAGEAGRQAGHLSHPVGGLRQRAAHGQQRVVADDPERRFVLALRDGLPPRVQLTERRQLTWPQRLGALHPQVRVLVAVDGSRPAQLLESPELLLGPGQASPRDELGVQ